VHDSRSSASDRRIGEPIRSAVTFGVEEEFLLVDPRTRLVVPKAVELLAEIPTEFRQYVKHELITTQLEISTPICGTSRELSDALTQLRSIVAAAADRVGCRVLPAGTGLLDSPLPASVPENPRFVQQAYDLGSLIDSPGLCACHVHVAVPGPDVAAAVSNHLRPWLPVLQTICTNSPFAEGRDTGYASWRSMLSIRYPTSGPPPWLDSAEHHDRLVKDLISAGVMADTKMVYWFTRPSPVYPTIEVRTADVCPTVDEAVFLAALVRALVLDAVARVEDGEQGPAVEDRLLVGAHWRSARYGIEGDGTDVLNVCLRPATDLVDRLIERVRPVLEALGDAETVDASWAAMRAQGPGAVRQRAARAAHNDLAAVVDYLLQEYSARFVNRECAPAPV
jgi:carboxylate-amine ligase